MNIQMTKSLTFLAALCLVAGCSSPVKLDENAGAKVEDRSGSTSQSSASDAQKVPTVDTTAGQSDPLAQGALANKTVYFDFDSYSVKDEYRGMVEAHSKYLNSQAARKVRIEGHTDERGGSEYNLALGQRRSEAVASMMRLLGVKEDQIETVSFGKEKPKATGSDEAAWAQNRRADVVYR